jgi:hypothetical protein
MKKALLFIIAMVGYTLIPAQEMISGGDMEDDSPWTILDVSSYGFDESTISFGYTLDTPADGSGGCLSIAGYGVTRNFIYQQVHLTLGHTYMLSAALKDGGETSISNYWVEVNLVKKEPELSGTGTDADFGATTYDFQLGMHYWKTVNGVAYDRLTSYDGLMQNTLPFIWLGALSDGTVDSVITSPRDASFQGAHGDSAIFTLPDTASTADWYVLIKAGAFMNAGEMEPAYNWLIDELSLWDMAEVKPPNAINNFESVTNVFNVFPNPSGGIVNIKSNNNNALTYIVYNLMGDVIRSGRLGSSNSIDLSNLNKGLYLVRITDGLKTEEHKLLLE